MLGMIAIELSMFMRWVEDNRGRMLNAEEIELIASKILERESFSYEKETLQTISLLALAGDVKMVDAMRTKTGFDTKVDGFCKSIGIEKP